MHPKSYSRFLIAAALLGASAVALGAFGAHGLKAQLSAEQLSLWQTAVQYQLYHSAALLALALHAITARPARQTAYAWLLGSLVFSGSLYAMALGAPKGLGALTPVGGLALLLGWLNLVRLVDHAAVTR